MKTKTSFRRAALPIISVLAAAIISLTSVTFAWFTYGNEAKVEQITVDVEAAGGLQISSNKDDSKFNWVSNVDLSELVEGDALTPVSASLNADKKLDFFTATYDDVKDKIYGITAQSGPDNNDRRNYVAFDLYFRNMENTQKTVSLQVDDNNKTTVSSPTGQSNLATRIAFLTDSYTMPTSTLLTNQKPWTTEMTVAKAVIFEPNAADHTTEGKEDYKLYNPAADVDAKYAYKAPTAATAETGVYFDRYTGDKYTFVDASDRNDGDNASYYVADATADKGFVQWDISKDYISMSASQANEYLANNSGATFYTKSGETYQEYDYEDGFPDGTYYRLEKTDVYKKEADSTTLQSVTTEDDLTETYFELAGQSITKVTVYIWLEGQDADCINSVAGYAFNVNLVFNARKVA